MNSETITSLAELVKRLSVCNTSSNDGLQRVDELIDRAINMIPDINADTITEPIGNMVRFKCGCLGFKLGDTQMDKNAIVIKDCTDGLIGFHYRGIDSPKQCTPLSVTEQQELMDKVAKLIVDGYHLHEVRSILSIIT